MINFTLPLFVAIPGAVYLFTGELKQTIVSAVATAIGLILFNSRNV